MSENVIVEVPVEIDDELLGDIICTAFEGGSNYWINTIKVNHPEGAKPKGSPVCTWASDAINKNGSVMIFPRECDGDVHTLNKLKLTTGLKMWVVNHPQSVTLVHEYGKNYIDAGNIDADDADCILQYALFNEVVFG